MITAKTISDEVFDSTYKPIDGADGDVVRRSVVLPITEVNHLWTLVDGDDGSMWLIPGNHVVNWVGYVLTEVPWETAYLEVLWLDPTGERCSEDDCNESLDDAEGYDGKCGSCADRNEPETVATADVIARIESDPELLAQVRANAQEAYDDWGSDPGGNTPPCGWIGGRVRNALDLKTDEALGTWDTEVGDPTGELGSHFYPIAEGT